MKITTILAGLLIGSIAYHLNVGNEKIMGIPSYQVSWISTSLGALIGAFLIRVLSKDKTSKVALFIFLGIILSVTGRILYDISFTPITHNMAPLEIIVYSILTIPTAFAGAYLGQIVNSWQKK